MKATHYIMLVSILAVAAVFRFTGINWDAGTHLHPDERFLTMVTTNISWPRSLPQYFDTGLSPANPHNRNFSFYVYGTYPMHLTKAVGTLLKRDSYDGITMVGRTLSALIDLVTVGMVFLIGRAVSRKVQAGLVAAFIYGIAVLPIQLSRFYTVDPYVTLFTTIALFRLIRGKLGIVLGVVTALAVGAKISAILLLAVVGFAYVLRLFDRPKHTPLLRHVLRQLGDGVLFTAGFAATLRLVYPYLFRGFLVNPLVLANWKQLASFNGPTTSFPPGLQWISVPHWQPAMDVLVWGLGIPLGIVTIASVVLILRTALARPMKHSGHLILLFFVLLMVGYQSVQFTKSIRYLWAIYPALAVLSGVCTADILTRLRRAKHATAFLIPAVILALLWPVSYLSIYTRPHTRVSASRWIFASVPTGSTIAWEHWDDPLPFGVDGLSPSEFTQVQLPVFDPDSDKKWQQIADALAQSDYVVVSSNRGYGAIGRAHARFPKTVLYYRKLFGGTLGFQKIREFVSRPGLPIPGVSRCITIPGFSYGLISKSHRNCTEPGIRVIDDYADESFTVYDHPVVTIWKNTDRLDTHELFRRITEAE